MNHKHSAERQVNPQKVKNFLKLQSLVNLEIDRFGQADRLSVKLLDMLGDSLNPDEIHAVCLEVALRENNQLN